MTRAAGRLAIAARQAVQSLVCVQFEVSVDPSCLLMNEHGNKERPRAGQSQGVVVLVELIGPDSESRSAARMISARKEAYVWYADEVVSAVRRAADSER